MSLAVVCLLLCSCAAHRSVSADKNISICNNIAVTERGLPASGSITYCVDTFRVDTWIYTCSSAFLLKGTNSHFENKTDSVTILIEGKLDSVYFKKPNLLVIKVGQDRLVRQRFRVKKDTIKIESTWGIFDFQPVYNFNTIKVLESEIIILSSIKPFV